MDNTTSKSLDTQDNIYNICFLLWGEFVQILHVLSNRIQADGSPEVIIGLQRGGLVPAVCLSHLLGIRQFLSLPMSRTTSDAVFAQKIAPVMQIEPDLLRHHVSNKDVLLVDDIVGTGESMKEALHQLTSFAPARIRSAICVVNRDNWDSNNALQPTEALSYIGKEVHGWTVFPWEISQDMCSTVFPSENKDIPFNTVSLQIEQ